MNRLPEFVATCALGTEPAVATELKALKVRHVRQGRGSVTFVCTLEDAMRVCLNLRSAMRVLQRLGTFECPDAEALYEGVKALPWPDLMTPRHTFTVDATGTNEALRHTGFTALKAKDAIADVMRDATGTRPDVERGKVSADVPVVVHIHKNECTVSLDMCGDALHRRGYRPQDAEAPLKETLAAAMLIMAGYTGDEPFMDPMAGSGTLVVEAAWMAMRRAPGLDRHFAFERWPNFAGTLQSAWHKLQHQARESIRTTGLPPVGGRDWLAPPYALLLESVERAGVAPYVQLEKGDVRKLALPRDGGHVVINPPYAERLGKPLQILGLYRSMGEVARTWHGWKVHVLSGHPQFEECFGLRPRSWQRLFNGPIECSYLHYEIPTARMDAPPPTSQR